MKLRIGLVVLATLMAPLSANASPFSILGGVGTTGVYGGAQYRESPYFTTQAQIGGFSLDPSFSSGGENYNLGVHLLNGLIAEQWHPWEQGFYLTAGVFINGNRLSLQPSASNAGNYALATPAKVTFNTIDPYFGIGYSQRFSSRSPWSFNLSAGAAYQGTPKVSVDQGVGPYAQYAYAAEVSNLNQSLDAFRWYPVVQVGIGYRW
ncbi:hypothetical protein [Acidithiobacillus sulfurivorans]|uniref:Outer membrane protein beta-barrel domain-containing protein n=1 Tax=Acidithiobacillus sulfurivorans TaxID=1958756 RepID=A0ABS6A230_9PROT|nr:hypothetical protein [Acidithiobacillus sulfurivorans]MBU2761427.1 hypothetical protein [Acidithiobacillus sulfurivorans]